MTEPTRDPVGASSLDDALSRADVELEAEHSQAPLETLGGLEDSVVRGTKVSASWSSAEMTVGNTRFDGHGGDEPELGRGMVLGRYVILDRLGSGGMGVVWAAYDPELDRKVAIKAVRLHGTADANATAHARLLREAQALARLSHPNVVAVHDVQMWEGQVCVAMEFVAGKTLGAWIKTSQPSREQVLSTLCAVGDGVVAAHRAGLVHRDLKPDNVMVGDDGRVRVMDFGLVRETIADSPMAKMSGDEAALLETGSRFRKTSSGFERILSARARSDAGTPGERGGKQGDDDNASESDSARSSRGAGSRESITHELTRAGALLGTPAYMSPEQFAGAEADARSDQFSFCVMAWEALYGERPFAGKSLAELAGAVALGQLRAPSDRAAANRAASVPSHLRLALLRGLASDPDKRWPSIDALLTELRRDPSIRRRRGLALILGGGVLAALFAGYTVDQGMRVRACQVEASAVEKIWNPDRAAQLEQEFAKTSVPHAPTTAALTIEALDNYAGKWRSLVNDACVARTLSGTRSLALSKRSQACFDVAGVQLEALVAALVEPNVDTVNSAVGRAFSLPLLDDCVDDARLLRSTDLPEDEATREQVLALYREAASASSMRGSEDLDIAQRRIEDTLERAKATGYVPVIVEAMADYGLLLELRSDFEPAVEQLRAAFVLAASAPDDATPHALAVRLSVLSATRLRESKAAHHWLTVAQFLRARLPERAPALDAQQEVASGYAELLDSRAQDALPHFMRALELHQSAYGPSTPGSARIQGYIATAHYELGEYERALEWDMRGLETLTATIGPRHPSLSTSYSNVGLLLEELGRLSEAREMLEKAADLEREYGGEDSAFLADVLTNQGVLESQAGNPEAALRYWQRAYEIWLARQGPTHPDVALARGNLAVAYLDLGRLEDAEREIQAALEGYQMQDVPEPLLILRARTNLGHIAIRREEWAKAREHLNAALAMSPSDDQHPERASVLHELARCDLHDLDAKSALERASEALLIREARLGASHADTLRTRLMIARALRMLGKADESRAMWSEIGRLRSEATDAHPDDAFSTELEGFLWLQEFQPNTLTRAMIADVLARAKVTPKVSPATIKEFEELDKLLASRRP